MCFITSLNPESYPAKLELLAPFYRKETEVQTV